MSEVNKKNPTGVRLSPWLWSEKPYMIAGPFMGQMILVVVDTSSKWTEAINTSGATISKVYGIFFTHGLPELLFIDSGIHKNYVKHSSIFSSIKWSDRERFEGREERRQENKKIGYLMTKCLWFLFYCRKRPHSSTGQKPSELMFY